MSIKVLNLINSLETGGAESLLVNFALESKKNEDIDLEICILYPSTFFKKEIQRADIPFWEFNLKFKYDLIGVLRLINLIKKRKYDIIHVHLFPSAMFLAIASFFVQKDIKFIFTEHSVYNQRRSFRIFKLLDIFIYSRYSKIICVNNQVRLSLIKWLPRIRKKTNVIFNGIPIAKLKEGQLFKRYDILFVGRLEKVKGLDILLRAISILNTQYNKVIRLAIVGIGPLKKGLEKMARELQIDDEIEFLGTRKDINRLMKSSKVLVLPSRWEGLPMVILEAMSVGLPIVATRVGGIPETIEDAKDGLLIPPENPEILAKTITHLLKNKNLQIKLAQNAYEKVKEKYSVQNYTKNILSLYEDLVK